MTKTAPTSNIDSFDRKILEIIQVSNRTTSDQIAEQVGLSPAAVQRRMKRMREQNIIKADIAVINPKAVGRGRYITGAGDAGTGTGRPAGRL